VLTNNTHGQNQFRLSDTVFEVGQVCRFNIIYDLSGRRSISQESINIADSIVNFLLRNNNIVVEFGVNSDWRMPSERNDTITKWRARSLRDYCVEKGIDKSRCSFAGYGEKNPLIVDLKIHNEYPFLSLGQELNEKYILSFDNKEEQEIANSLNRRTEIKIIKINSP
jgi:peptidoglycan-associated lipoprotein